jgi:hypothetical protein
LDAPRFELTGVPAPVPTPLDVAPGFQILPPGQVGAGGYVAKIGFTPYALAETSAPPQSPFPPNDLLGSASSVTGALPFAFPYFGTLYPAQASIVFDSNGALILAPGPGVPAWALTEAVVPAPFPSPAIPPSTIAPFWGSLSYRENFGASDHSDGFIWASVPGAFAATYVADYQSGLWGAAEVALYPSGRIRVRYAGSGSAEVSVGVQDGTQSRGLSLPCSPNCFLPDGTVVSFYPPALPYPELTLETEPLPSAIVSATATHSLDLPYRIRNSGTGTAAFVLSLLFFDDTDPVNENLGEFFLTFADPFAASHVARLIPGPSLEVGPGETLSGVASFDLTGLCVVCRLALYAAPPEPDDDDGDRLLVLGSVQMLDALHITTNALPTASVDRPYSFQLTADRANVLFSVVGLPDFLRASGDGTVSGTPTIRGTFELAVSASSSRTETATRALTLIVE